MLYFLLLRLHATYSIYKTLRVPIEALAEKFLFVSKIVQYAKTSSSMGSFFRH